MSNYEVNIKKNNLVRNPKSEVKCQPAFNVLMCLY